jgi:hypothetical protein
MADYKATTAEFQSVANAIRTKGGTSSQLVWPTGFVSAVNAIPTGGGGSVNVRSGSIPPSSNIGNNGDIYLEYIEIPEIPGYTPLVGIISNGPQWIDTGVPARVQMRVEFQTTWTTTGDNTFIGGTGNANNNAIYFGFNTASSGGYAGIESAWKNIAFPDYHERVYVISDMKSEQQKVIINNNVRYSGSTVYTTTSSSVNMGLFSRRGSGGYSGITNFVKIYDYLEDRYIRDFRPAMRNSDDVIGMYDLINDVFYVNAGSGTFTASEIAYNSIIQAYCKVNGVWQSLIGTDIDDVNLGGN